MNPYYLLISTGDPAGIGPEICIKTLKILTHNPYVKIIPVGNIKLLQEAAELCNYKKPLIGASSIDEISDFTSYNEVLNIELNTSIDKGKISEEGGRYTYKILETSSKLCLSGKTAGMVTCPINKEAIKLAGYKGQGHTEILRDFAGISSCDTIFCIEKLKIFFLSRHVSLFEAIKLINKQNVFDALLRIDRIMKTIGFVKPRIGLPGLNPHCGDGGLFGREEIDELIPAVKEAVKKGIAVEGPIGADSIYHLGISGKFDAILSLYHDQGHIASKTYDFYKTITMTVGLPYLRTSVDHGTGFDIAWKGIANPESLVKAVELAMDLILKK